MHILDFLFPKRCVGCGTIGTYFCNRCTSTIQVIAPNEAICPVCEKPAIDGATHPGCKTHYSLDGLTSFFCYDGVIRKAVKAIKYRYVSDLAKEFISLIPIKWIPGPSISAGMQARDDKVILIPIPLHWLRLRDRGFNQAEALGRLLADQLHIALRTDILTRVKMTTPQVAMKDRGARLKNMDGVFALHQGFDKILLKQKNVKASNMKILLVDDVFTTGATMRAAASVLKRAGVKFVWGMTMAR